MSKFGPVFVCLGLSLSAANHPTLRVKDGVANALFFITGDCPISNGYAPEISRICSAYRTQGINCTLVYVDPALSDERARSHALEFGLGGLPKLVDRKHELVRATRVKNTPEVAVIAKNGKVAYRGRIDDSYAALGQPRRPAKNPDLRKALDAIVAGRPVTAPETKALGCYISDLARRR